MAKEKSSSPVEATTEHKAAEKAKPKCFVITPIGGDSSQVRRATDGLDEAVIKPILEGIGFDVDVAHTLILFDS